MNSKEKQFDIVFVDDEIQVTSLLSSFMEIFYGETDFTWKTFNNPLKAIEELRDGELTSKVWLIDLMMPGDVDGVVLAEEVRKSISNHNAIIYAYTALSVSSSTVMEVVVRVTDDGLKVFNGVYNKQMTPDVLLDKIVSSHLMQAKQNNDIDNFVLDDLQ